MSAQSRDRRRAGRARGPESPERREFLMGAALAGGGIALGAAMPWSRTWAAPRQTGPDGAPSPAALSGAPGRPAALADWSIDDVWGAYPRYADPIGFGRRPEERMAAVGSLDPLSYC